MKLLHVGRAAVITSAACLGVAGIVHAQTTTLTYLTWGDIPQEKQIIDQFEQAHPDIKIQREYIGWGTDKLLAKIAAGESFDLFAMDAYWAQQFFASGDALSLDAYVQRDGFDLGLYLPPLVREDRGNLDGKLYAVDYAGYNAIQVGYVNLDMFRAAGLQAPADNWTWNDFRQDSKKLTLFDSSGQPTRYGSVGAAYSFDNAWYPFLLSNGGQVLDASHAASRFGSAASVETFDFLTSLVQEDHSAPSPAEFAARKWGWLGNAFINQDAAISFDWDNYGGYRDQIKDRFDWRMVTIPGSRGGNVSVIKGNALSIYAKSKHPDAAWEFLKFYSSEPIQRMLYSEGWKPWMTAVRSDPQYTRFNAPPYDATVAFNQKLDVFPFVPEWMKISAIWQRDLNKAFSGEVAVKPVLNGIDDQVQAVLNAKSD